MGEALSVGTYGVSFVLRPTVAVVRSPIAFELGLQLKGGVLADTAFPALYTGNVEYETSDGAAFYFAKNFQVGVYVGVTIPLWSTARPIVALNVGITNGIGAYPTQYYLDVAVGASWFVTRLVELRFEILGLELRRVDAEVTPIGGTDSERVRVWIFHLVPTLLVNLRF